MKPRGTSLLAHGESQVWLIGGALVLCVAMIVGLLGLIGWQGFITFWPQPVVEVTLRDGAKKLGDISREEVVDGNQRLLLRTGNFDASGTHFEWVSDSDVASETRPEWALVVERRSWGRFYGQPVSFRIDGNAVAHTPAEVWTLLDRYLEPMRENAARRLELQRQDIGRINAAKEKARIATLRAQREYGEGSPEFVTAVRSAEELSARVRGELARIAEDIAFLDTESNRYGLELETASGQRVVIPLATVVRVSAPNRMDWVHRASLYASRWHEFLTAEPREANSEGGVWPAIVGTVIMTLLMSLAVVPFGVLAALYLREYARRGAVVSAVRIAVNNLAGVPSIVFGVFGLGFFCYIMGGSIDATIFSDRLPNPTFGKGGVLWASLTLALLTLPVVVVAAEEAISSVPQSMRMGSYACGASRWQTIHRIVLPRAMPGIMTGFILAMARGAGEVAPLMLVGAVKLAPELPVDSVAPFVHLERSFMHLGFHIYDVGFQSQNSEAARAMVYTTTLLLVAIILALNLASVWVRTRMRKRFTGSAF